MTLSTTKTRRSPELARLLGGNRREAVQLRREFGDPEEAFSAFVRETFDQEALEVAFNDMMAGATMWDTDHETGDQGAAGLSISRSPALLCRIPPSTT